MIKHTQQNEMCSIYVVIIDLKMHEINARIQRKVEKINPELGYN